MNVVADGWSFDLCTATVHNLINLFIRGFINISLNLFLSCHTPNRQYVWIFFILNNNILNIFCVCRFISCTLNSLSKRINSLDSSNSIFIAFKMTSFIDLYFFMGAAPGFYLKKWKHITGYHPKTSTNYELIFQKYRLNWFRINLSITNMSWDLGEN